MIRKLWKTATRIALLAAAVMSFFVLVELLRAYQTLHDMHPVAGYVFAGLVGVVLVYFVGHLLGGWKRHPKVLKPPRIDDLDTADGKTLGKYGRYLFRYLRRLSRNASLGEASRARATEAARTFYAGLKAGHDIPQTRVLLKAVETDHIEPLLAELDDQAEKEIQSCVLDVMIGVAASPWDAVDLLVVLYRNGGMIARITRIYDSQPPLRERLSVFADTVRIVAMIKFGSLTQKLVTNAPLVRRVVKPLVQAVGAGVFTSVAGHAAKHRCRAFRGWDQKEEVQRLRGMLGQYLTDCWRWAGDQVVPILRTVFKLPAAALERVRQGFGSAITATAGAADKFVRQPVTAGAGGTTRGTRRLLRRVFGRRKG